MCKKEFKGRNGKKPERNYTRYIMGADIKSCILNITPEMRCQLSYLLTNKRTRNDLLQRRMIINNYCACVFLATGLWGVSKL